MLTQGWSRFNVEDLLKEQQTNPQYFMEVGQFVSGKVLDIRNKPLAGKHVNVFVNKRLILQYIQIVMEYFLLIS